MANSPIQKSGSRIDRIELVYHSRTRPEDRPKITNSDEAYRLLLDTWDMDKIELQEQFRVMLLDRGNRSLGVSTIATGGISGTLVDLRLVFALALQARASSIILAHNHPSGNTQPSESDKSLTAKFKAAAALLNISLLDHLVVTPTGYTSFTDAGFMP